MLTFPKMGVDQKIMSLHYKWFFILTVLNLIYFTSCYSNFKSINPSDLTGPPVEGEVVINEFMASNLETVADDNGEYDDWIELYNKSGNPVSLDGYYMSDDGNELTEWMFPDTSLPAHGFLLIWADEDIKRPR